MDTNDYRDLIRLAIATFAGQLDAPDDVLVKLLTDVGVAPGVAARLVVFVPFAFGRVMLTATGVTTTPKYLYGEQGDEADVSSEPIFVATAEMTQKEIPAEAVRAIGQRSSEVQAFTELAAKGNKPEDVTFSTPRLPLVAPATDEALVVPHRDRARGAMQAVFTAMKVPFTVKGTEIDLGEGAALEARVFPRRVTAQVVELQLDVRLKGPILGDRALIESFAGAGPNLNAAVDGAIAKFASASLPILLGAVLVREGGWDQQCEWQTWETPKGTWHACVGPLLQQNAVQMKPIAVGQFLERLKERWLAQPQQPKLHWVRFYYAHRGGPIGGEVLVDNQPWPDMLAELMKWPWPESAEFYAVRLFFVLIPG